MYKIDQTATWQRIVLLLSILFIITLLWYLFLLKPLLERNQAVLLQQAHDQELLKELNSFTQAQASFVYKKDISALQMRQVFQEVLSSAPGMSMTSYTDKPVVVLPATSTRFPSLPAALSIAFSKALQQSSATILLSGTFSNFIAYLDSLQSNSQPVYFESIDFNMNRYPKAEITMQVFALEG